ncbi:hypothetical protein N7449_004077 [Penicillium cf. viridicatum]|uniref:Uncharacterized protein n=1 Tax=Penicillium cf. viridicatum TaxID=2972119 RepID=A0A9W9MY41_9EURO|nr:hypothetical protein N7449_004077 [Penicillium cf. viridicatum]
MLELADVAAVQVGDALVQRAGLVRPSKQKLGGDMKEFCNSRRRILATRALTVLRQGQSNGSTWAENGPGLSVGETRHRALRPEVA